MELSKTFGVERGNPFEVKGYKGKEFRINTFVSGVEYLEIRNIGGIWDLCQVGIMCNIIAAAPSGIIHLPPPLTDEQREQLKALFTIGYLYLAKDKDETVYAYETRPHKVCKAWHYENGDSYMLCTKQTVCLGSLVAYSDPEPLGIGEALGVTE